MILVRTNSALIPAKLLAVASRAEAKLNQLPPADRPAFIKKKAHIWRNLGRYLSQMSYGKCWYSESPDPQSFFDVDHFRPKLEAKRSDTQTDPGYEWLAFSWDNFRYSAGCCNRQSQNHQTGVVEGKSSWFPLLPGSGKATWANRNVVELPLLLDPVNATDVDLVTVDEHGRVVPKRDVVGTARTRVIKSCEFYGLNLPRIKDARKHLVIEITDMVETYIKMAEAWQDASIPDVVADKAPLNKQKDIIRRKTRSDSPYSLAARAVLIRMGLPDLCEN